MKKTIAIMLTVLSLGIMGQSSSVSMEDEKFVKEAIKGNAKEVKLGQIAASKGSTAEVRKLGQTMVDDHTKAGNEIKSLAEKKGIKFEDPDMDKECKKCCDNLSKKAGKDFDKAYTEMMVKDHKKDISEFKKEKDNGKDSDIKSWATTTLPTLEHHLSMSETACKDTKM